MLIPVTRPSLVADVTRPLWVSPSVAPGLSSTARTLILPTPYAEIHTNICRHCDGDGDRRRRVPPLFSALANGNPPWRARGQVGCIVIGGLRGEVPRKCELALISVRS